MTEYRCTPLCVQNRIQVQMRPWMLVETTRVTEFEYYFGGERITFSVEAVEISTPQKKHKKYARCTFHHIAG